MSDTPEIRYHHLKLNQDGLRFLVLHRNNEHLAIDASGNPIVVCDDEDPLYDLHGTPSHPALFKTMRMAMKAARDRWTWGKKQTVSRQRAKVLLFDPNYLPMVVNDVGLLETPGLADRISDVEFCERQSQLWAQQALLAQERERSALVI